MKLMRKENNANSHDDIVFEDPDAMPTGSANSYKEILLQQLRKATSEGSKEMTKGGLMRRLVNGEVQEFPVPNQVEIFCNSVEMLLILIQPKIKEKKEYGEWMRKIQNETKERREEIKKQKDEFIRDFNSKTANYQTTYYGYFKNSIQNFESDIEQERIAYCNKVLACVSDLLNSLKYFEEATAEF